MLWKVLPQPKPPRVAVRVPFGNRIREAATKTPAAKQAARRSLTFIIPSLVWILALTALARPQWLEPPISKVQPTRDLLLLVDLSGSMDQEDFKSETGEPVNRLETVKNVVGEFLIQRKGDRVGLVVFGNAAFLQAPFSTDLELTRTLLEDTAVGMAGPRTAFGDAIGLGISLFDDSDAPAKTIIALTDGNDTASDLPPVEAARVASERDIRIHTVAMGDPQTVGENKLDEAALRDVAQATGGSYFFAADRDALSEIYAELDQIETREIKEISHRPRRDLFHWPLLLAVLLSLAAKTIQSRRKAKTSASTQQATGTLRVNPVTGKLDLSA